MDYLPYLEEQIKILERTIRSYQWWICGLIICGICILIIATILPLKQSIQPGIIRIGGFFIAALSTIPYKEIPPIKIRIATYKFIKQNFEKNKKMSSTEKKRLTELILDAIKENLKK